MPAKENPRVLRVDSYFIQAAGLVYHHAVRVYIIAKDVYHHGKAVYKFFLRLG